MGQVGDKGWGAASWAEGKGVRERTTEICYQLIPSQFPWLPPESSFPSHPRPHAAAAAAAAAAVDPLSVVQAAPPLRSERKDTHAPNLSVSTEKGGGGDKMNRRFVHLVLCNAIAGRSGFTMHSISSASLFNPSSWSAPNRCAEEVGHTVAMEHSELPSPAMSFYRPCLGNKRTWMEFMRLGQSSSSKVADNIISTDHEGRTIAYDPTSGAVGTMPSLHAPKSFPVSLSIGDSLYVINSNPLHANCFEALIHGFPPDNMGNEDWYWHSLPTPSYVYEPTGFEEDEDGYQNPHAIRAYTVVGDSRLWYSTIGVGTYCFETTTRVWHKVGDWSMPFRGYVEYVAEHGLWFGLSSDDDENKLCMSNLETKDKPVVLKSWQYLTSPQDWIPYGSYLVPLGSSKFCIARIFATAFEHDTRFIDSTFAVFTGVEVVMTGGAGLEMILHKSIRLKLQWREA
ncbi:hypothetical protein EJB05_08202, partial [Eragrostis curvula]